ncbi:MAG: hypothetical protein K0S76_444 [Herbinix sp.]|jgi:ribosomal protein S27E|nr:hypothetical protein [Herbinix sp.]
MLRDKDNELIIAIKANEPLNKFIIERNHNIKHGKYIAHKCYDCGEINVYPTHKSDGQSCIACGGRNIPIGTASIFK